jgi:tetratricopeptide (TPR) repeat protein
MSVILNALRQQAKQASNQTQGFFWSKASRTPRIPYVKVGLGLALAVVTGFTVVGFVSWVRKPVPVQKIAAPVPVKPPDYARLGQEAFERSDFTSSIDLFQKALAQSPQDWVLLNNMGLALAKTGKLEEAESYFFKAIASNVNCASCYNNLGDLEMKRGFLEEAELYYQKATKADPDYADPYFNLGVLQEKNGEVEAAVESYESFLDLQTDKKSPLYQKVKKRLKEIQMEFQ